MSSGPRRTIERPLDLLRELLAVGVAAAAITLAFVLGVLAGPLPAQAPLEARVAWVLALASLGGIAGWIVQNESRTRVRVAPALLLVISGAHLLAPWSVLFSALAVLVVLGSASIVLVRAVWRIALRRHESPPRRRLRWVILLLLAFPGPLGTLGWGLSSSILVPALVRTLHRTPHILEDEIMVDLTTDDGLSLSGGYLRGETGAPGVVLVHGRNDSRRRMEGWARTLSAHGAHVLRFDQRANGVSDGAVCTYADREPRDVATALRWLARQRGVDRARLGALGTSMGGGAILAALPELEGTLRAFVALAPVSDYPALVTRYFPPEPLATPTRAMVYGVPHALGYASPLELVPARRAARSHIPGLVVHGRGDHTILPEQTERLLALRPDLEVLWLDGVGHDEIPYAARENARARATILARLLDESR